MIRTVLKKIYLSITVGCFFIFPLELYAGDTYGCGDWACSTFGYATTANYNEENRPHQYHILLLENQNETFSKYHYLSPGLVGLKKEDSVTFKFDNLIKIRVPVIDTNRDRVVFSPLDFVPSLEAHLKKEIQFSIIRGDQKLAGPFSLVGSERAINTAINTALSSKYFNFTLSNLFGL